MKCMKNKRESENNCQTTEQVPIPHVYVGTSQCQNKKQKKSIIGPWKLHKYVHI